MWKAKKEVLADFTSCTLLTPLGLFLLLFETRFTARRNFPGLFCPLFGLGNIERKFFAKESNAFNERW